LQYRTKVDSWLVVVLAGAVALPIAIGIVGYWRVGAGPAAWLPVSIAALMVITICIVAVPTRYEVRPSRLVIRSGFLRWEVPRADILSITPTSNPLSGPAWSLERLEVTWMHAGSARSILISPQRKEEFLREVAGQDGTLVVADGHLQRVH
jgi:membrane protein YdbS with pleckstrin-like domain